MFETFYATLWQKQLRRITMAQYQQLGEFAVPTSHMVGYAADIETGNNLCNGSVFVPSIHRNISEESMRMMFRYIGEISRVDWAEMTPPKTNFCRAFVHFENFDSEQIDKQRTIQYSISPKYDCVYSATVLPAKNPVPRTNLNIHQVAHNLKVFEETVWGALHKKEEEVRNMQELIEELQKKLRNQEATIHILLTRPVYPSPPILRRQSAESFTFGGFSENKEDGEISENTIERITALMPSDDWLSAVPCTREGSQINDLDSVDTSDSMPALTALNHPDSWDEHIPGEPVVIADKDL